MPWKPARAWPICLALTLAVSIVFVAGCRKEPQNTEQKSSAISSGKGGPTAAAEGIGADGRLHPSETDHCPVCAMTTHDRKMGAAIELSDGRTFYFCGPGCLLKAALHPEAFLGARGATVERAVVTEFFTGRSVDVSEVTWVAGSDVVGPMGTMIVPIAGQKALTTFLERHGGTTTFTWAQLNDELWENITGKRATSDGKR